MRLNRIAAVALRQYYLARGSFTRLLPMFIWVAIDIVLWGFITRFLNNFAGTVADFVPLMLGCVLLWDFLVRVLQGVTMAFMEDSWSRNFLNMFASPLRIPEYLAGLVLSSICTSALGLAAMLLLATFVFGLSFAAYGAMFVPFLFILFLFGIALGILGCSIMLRLGPAAEWFVWPIPAIISPFCGVYYPLSTLPHWMQMVSTVLPPAYVFEGMRGIVTGKGVAAGTLVAGLGLSVFYIFLMCLLFNFVYRYSVKVGLIARYSAETVS